MIQVTTYRLSEVAKALSGIPYKHYGRDENGTDCFGLIILFFKYLGITIADQTAYSTDWWKGADLITDYPAEQFKIVDKAVPGAVAAMGINSAIPNHLLMVVSSSKLLHCTQPTGVHFLKCYPLITRNIVWYKQHSELQVI